MVLLPSTSRGSGVLEKDMEFGLYTTKEGQLSRFTRLLAISHTVGDKVCITVCVQIYALAMLMIDAYKL